MKMKIKTMNQLKRVMISEFDFSYNLLSGNNVQGVMPGNKQSKAYLIGRIEALNDLGVAIGLFKYGKGKNESVKTSKKAKTAKRHR